MSDFRLNTNEELTLDDGRVQGVLYLLDSQYEELAKRTSMLKDKGITFEDILQNNDTTMSAYVNYYGTEPSDVSVTVCLESESYGWESYNAPITKQEADFLFGELEKYNDRFNQGEKTEPIKVLINRACQWYEEQTIENAVPIDFRKTIDETSEIFCENGTKLTVSINLQNDKDFETALNRTTIPKQFGITAKELMDAVMNDEASFDIDAIIYENGDTEVCITAEYNGIYVDRSLPITEKETETLREDLNRLADYNLDVIEIYNEGKECAELRDRLVERNEVTKKAHKSKEDFDR